MLLSTVLRTSRSTVFLMRSLKIFRSLLYSHLFLPCVGGGRQ